MITEFRIDQTEFKVDLDGSNEIEKFVVKSFPRDYSISFMNDFHSLIEKFSGSEMPIVVDENIYKMHRADIDYLSRAVYRVSPTETNKTVETALDIVKFLDKQKINKGRPTLAIGGGIVQDLAGFACGVYRRGVPWVYCPTTLLGQADSCLGGKTGLNFDGKKNVVCSFYAPVEGVICTEFLTTLPDDHVRCGLGEMFRLSLTGGDVAFDRFERLVKNAEPISANEIRESLLIKRAVVEHDEYEVNERRAMNVGHTFGHALEAATGNAIPHGIAVAYGIGIEALMARKLISTSSSTVMRICSILRALKSDKEIALIRDLNLDQLLSPLLADKKMIGDALNFSFVRSVGDIQFHPVAVRSRFDEIKSFVIEFCELMER